MIGYDFRSVRRRRNQQPPQTDKVITTSTSPRLLKPYILLKEQTRRSRRRRSPGASKRFKQPGRISSKDEDKKNKEPNKLSKITQSFPKKDIKNSTKKTAKSFTKTYVWKKKNNNNKPSKAPNQASKRDLSFFKLCNFPKSIIFVKT
jgi:hypothetical protein